MNLLDMIRYAMIIQVHASLCFVYISYCELIVYTDSMRIKVFELSRIDLSLSVHDGESSNTLLCNYSIVTFFLIEQLCNENVTFVMSNPVCAFSMNL